MFRVQTQVEDRAIISINTSYTGDNELWCSEMSRAEISDRALNNCPAGEKRMKPFHVG